MGFNEGIQAISTVGFPIVMCVGMAYFVKYLMDKHTAEMKEVTQSINNNTIALTKLCEKMEVK